MITLYNKTRTGATIFWSCYVEGAVATMTSGQLGTTTPKVSTYPGIAKNVGKKNEVTAEQDALNEATKRAKNKARGGYVSSITEREEEVNEGATFTWPLPSGFRIYKPKSAVTPSMKKCIKAGDVYASRKYDGEMMMIVMDGSKARILSRTLLEHHHKEEGEFTWNDRFPHIVDEFESTFGDNVGLTVFAGEISASKRMDSDDDRWYVAKVMKSKTEKAIKLQNDEYPLRYIIWDTPIVEGEIHSFSYSVRQSANARLTADMKYVFTPWVFPVKSTEYGTVDAYLSNLMSLAVEYGWEGFVLSSRQDSHEGKIVNVRGKTDRPSTFCKLKPIFEDDFIAYWDPTDDVGTYAKGDKAGSLGAVELYQIDKDGEQVFVCNCGGGFTDAFRNDAVEDDFPMVMEVMFESRTYVSKGDKTNAL